MTVITYTHPFHKLNQYKPIHTCHFCNQLIKKTEKEVYVSSNNGRRDYYAHISCIEKNNPS